MVTRLATQEMLNEKEDITNAKMFVEEVTKHIKKADGELNLIIKGGKEKFEVPLVKKVILVKRDAQKKKRANVHIISEGSKPIPLNIKRDNDKVWAETDYYFGKTAKKTLDDNEDIAEIEPIKENSLVMKIAKNIIVPATVTEKKLIIFGADIKGIGAVIIKTFRQSDFKYDKQKGDLNVNVSFLIEKAADIYGKKRDLWFLIKNDETKKSKEIGVYGITTFGIFKEKIKKEDAIVKR